MYKFTAALMLAAGASATSLTSSAAFTGRTRSREPKPKVDPELLEAVEDMHAVVDLNDDDVITVDELSESLFRF